MYVSPYAALPSLKEQTWTVEH